VASSGRESCAAWWLACEAKSARLIFFDNVYLYERSKADDGGDAGAASSAKGEIRAEIAGFRERSPPGASRR
jgi:hypothetical protein